jgi:hypothetical protein
LSRNRAIPPEGLLFLRALRNLIKLPELIECSIIIVPTNPSSTLIAAMTAYVMMLLLLSSTSIELPLLDHALSLIVF